MTNESLADRFRASLSSYDTRMEASQRYTNFNMSMKEALEWSFEAMTYGGPIEEGLYRAAFGAFIREFANSEIWSTVYHPAKMCGSPIEVALCFALGLVGRQLADNVVYKAEAYTIAHPVFHKQLEIAPQSQLGNYRVDFLLTLRARCWDAQVARLSRRREPPNECGEYRVIETQVVVECDGHDFHERTKEQAAHDRKRDRLLQDLGFKVFRFTGSEIWKDVFRCAEEAILSLVKESDRKEEALKTEGGRA